MKGLLLTASCSLIPFLNIMASDNINGIDSLIMKLDEVVVTGTRTPRLLKDTPVQTRLIIAKEIRQSDATDISGLLADILPGIEFTYSMNQQTHMNFGSFGGRSVLFLIDGERLAGETMDDIDFSRIDMNNVERIEIVRGASSALYGSNAAGGVINVITAQPKKRWEGDLRFRLSRHNERRYTAKLNNRFNHISNTLSFSANRIDTYSLKNGEDPAGRVITAVYGHRTLNVSDQLKWSPSARLSLSAKAAFHMREIFREVDLPDRYRSYSGLLKGEWAPSLSDRLEISYLFDQFDKSQFNKLASLEIRSYSNVQNSLRAFYTHSFPAGDILSVGTDFIHDWLHNTKMRDADKKEMNFDLFAQYDLRINSRWEIVGALRYDYFSENHLSRVTPKISARFSPSRRLSLRAAWGMGFRAPTLKEKYYEFDMAGIWIVEGNPDLKPETSRNIDISAEYTILNYNFTASANYNHVSNRISTGLPHSYPSDPDQLFLSYINLDGYRSAGVELSAQANWKCGLSARISYAWIHERTIKDKDGNTFNNQYMPPRPHSLTANAVWDHRVSRDYSVNIGLSGRFLSAVTANEYKDYYDTDAGITTVKYPAYSLWKLSATQTLYKRIELTLSLDNIFNYRPKYYYMNSPTTDGISFSVVLGIEV